MISKILPAVAPTMIPAEELEFFPRFKFEEPVDKSQFDIVVGPHVSESLG